MILFIIEILLNKVSNKIKRKGMSLSFNEGIILEEDFILYWYYDDALEE